MWHYEHAYFRKGGVEMNKMKHFYICCCFVYGYCSLEERKKDRLRTGLYSLPSLQNTVVPVANANILAPLAVQ